MIPINSKAAEIRALNDEFRRQGPLFGRTKFDGLWLVAADVQARGPSFIWQAIARTQAFDGFTAADDPFREHASGSFEVGEARVVWQFDYLQRGTPFEAQDPSDNSATCRMLIIMLADEG
jgi:hypothetical protein